MDLFEIKVNGESRHVATEPDTPVVDVLRDDLHLTGTKVSCREGFCGACTVLVAGQQMVSCLLPVGLLDGREVRTVESLADTGGSLSSLQEAFKDGDAVQCGMCFPGILMSLAGTAGLQAVRNPEDVRRRLVGNICRCTGYERIVEIATATLGEDDQA